MTRRANAGYTAHELMAFSGHKTLTEVQRYTDKANMKRLAASGDAKLRTNGAEDYTNSGTELHKQGKKSRKINS